MTDLGTYRRTITPLPAGGILIWLVFTHAAPPAAARWMGLALALLGLTGVVLARWTLGSSFSITPQARHLVTRGIYSRIRNPIYISGTILLAGLIVMLHKPWLWAALAALAVLQFLRARKEARMLEAKFGEEYRHYRERTWI